VKFKEAGALASDFEEFLGEECFPGKERRL